MCRPSRGEGQGDSKLPSDPQPPLPAATIQRLSRQIALPEIGPDGQRRLLDARIAVCGSDLLAEIAARYLVAAGAGTIRLIGVEHLQGDSVLRASHPDAIIEHRPWPSDGAAWLGALQDVDMVVRSGFDDDAMLRAAVRLGVPVVVARSQRHAVELISFRKHGPCPHAPLDVPPGAAASAPGGPGAVVAGTLAAAEAIHSMLGNGGDAPARHLTLPLDGTDPRAQQIPWSPECFACGGSGSEMSFS